MCTYNWTCVNYISSLLLPHQTWLHPSYVIISDLTKTLADKEMELAGIQLALGRANVSEAGSP